ncbi:hypothetical protein ACVWY6_003395 [Williamsia sp. R60]
MPEAGVILHAVGKHDPRSAMALASVHGNAAQQRCMRR